VYIRCVRQGNHHTYGHIRCVYTVLANPSIKPKRWTANQTCNTHPNGGLSSLLCTQHIHPTCHLSIYASRASRCLFSTTQHKWPITPCSGECVCRGIRCTMQRAGGVRSSQHEWLFTPCSGECVCRGIRCTMQREGGVLSSNTSGQSHHVLVSVCDAVLS